MSRRAGRRALFILVLALTTFAFSAYLVALVRVRSSLRAVHGETEMEEGRDPAGLGSSVHLRGTDPGSAPRSEEARTEEELRATLTSKRKRFYLPGELDRFAFGKQLLEAVAEAGLDAERVGVPRAATASRENRSTVELSLTGSAERFLRFVRAVELHNKYWSIESCSLRPFGKGLTADLIVGYHVHEQQNR